MKRWNTRLRIENSPVANFVAYRCEVLGKFTDSMEYGVVLMLMREKEHEERSSDSHVARRMTARALHRNSPALKRAFARLRRRGDVVSIGYGMGKNQCYCLAVEADAEIAQRESEIDVSKLTTQFVVTLAGIKGKFEKALCDGDRMHAQEIVRRIMSLE